MTYDTSQPRMLLLPSRIYADDGSGYLFNKASFMNNPVLDTHRNEYYGVHCTAPSRMSGYTKPAEPYILRSHAEAGWGCVPQVLLPEGQEVTMFHYFAGKSPKMSVYTGEIVRCYPKKPAACRTNMQMTINEVADIHDLVLGMHSVTFYGNGKSQLQTFCKLFNVELAG